MNRAKFPRPKPTRPLGSFFIHGSVKVMSEDMTDRHIQFLIVMPACVMQAVTPLLLGAGLIDQYELRKPLSAWIPMIADEGFSQNSDPNFPTRINALMRQSVKETLDLFSLVSSHLKFPADALPVLPIGVYVQFKFRCNVDALGPLLENMGGAAGVAEFRFALASVLASVLARWDRPGQITQTT
jgi:hypothetical protein